MWESEVRKKTELAVQRIVQEARGTTKGADVLKWWTLMATDVIAHLSFGESFGMLELGKVCLSIFPSFHNLRIDLMRTLTRKELII